METKTGRFEHVAFDESAQTTRETFRAKFEDLFDLIDSWGPRTREQSMTLTKLEEAFMWLERALRTDQILRREDGMSSPRPQRRRVDVGMDASTWAEKRPCGCYTLRTDRASLVLPCSDHIEPVKQVITRCL